MFPIFRHDDRCPFCNQTGRGIFKVRYSETAEANPAVEDIEGQILACDVCGVAYPDARYSVKDFAALYAKSLDDLSFFNRTILQSLRRTFLASLTRLQLREPVSAALQIPIHDRVPKAVLDVGTGFGEFADAYRRLGATVAATEVIPQLVELCRKDGLDCHFGALEELDFGDRQFDLILFRAVLYRTQDPRVSFAKASSLLAPGGAISVLDPCVDCAGIEYFARKQFPQGRYYILDQHAFAGMLERTFGLRAVATRRIYGRPNAPLKKVSFWGNISGLGELLLNNALHRKPYMLAYLLRRTDTIVGRVTTPPEVG